jgi:hypothetical protein
MERRARQQVDTWQRSTRDSLWSGYGDDDLEDVDLDDDHEAYPRRIVRPPSRKRRRRG